MIFSDGTQVRGLYLRNRSEFDKYFAIHDAVHHVVGIDMNPKNKRVYWTDLGDGNSTVYSCDFDGKNMQVVINSGLRATEDVAYDFLGDNVYITDSAIRKIVVCREDGSVCSVLFDDVDLPRSLALDPNKGYMYWSEWGKSAGIYMSGMDGSERQTLVDTDIEWPNGLALDKTTDRIYWADAKLRSIEYYDIVLKKRTVLREDTVFKPFSMAVFEDNLYWSDWLTFTLDVCNKFTGRNQMILLRESDHHMMGVHIYHPSLYRHTRNNPCWSHSCSHMCLIGPKGSRKCACPAHLKLDGDGETCVPIKKSFALVSLKRSVKRIYPETIGKDVVETIAIPHQIAVGDFAYDPDNDVMYVYDMEKYMIKAVNMTAGTSASLVHGLGSVQGLSYDHCTRNLYWLESSKGHMEVFSIATHARAVLIKDLERPMDLALNPEDMQVFIANLGTEPYILQANMDGSNPVKLFAGSSIGLPVAIVYMPDENRLYWSDAKKGTIESILLSEVDSGRRTIVRENLGHVMSIAVHANILYWTDMDHGYLCHSPIAERDSKPQMVPLPGEQAVSSIKKIKMIDAEYDRQHDYHSDHCAKNNGGCSHLCLLGPSGPECVCPEKYSLKSDSKTCQKEEPCNSDDFICHSDNQCVMSIYRCDKNNDCDDGSDELNCTAGCPPDDWECANGKCIIGVWRCDRNNDCGDNSDEANCTEHHNCGDGHFNCGDGQCIPQLWKCDSHPDCANRMDEENCTTNACQKDATQLQCGDGSCVPTQWKCDGEADCPDAADERDCEEKECTENEFKCGNHACIDKSLVCDGHIDCTDKRDEMGCNIVFKCGSGMIPFCRDGHCIYQSDLCDGHMDCDHGEDENNCTDKVHECSSHETYCGPNATTTCIPSVWICDGENDCGDWSDENKPQCLHRNEDSTTTTTSRPCKDGSFPCGSGECVPYDVVCNQHDDCIDGSDEGEKCHSLCDKKTECAQGCKDTPNGPMCTCGEGYKLANDSIACEDIDECKEYGHCSQHCNNLKGSFKCTCDPGYILAADLKRCKAVIPPVAGQPHNVQIVYMLPDRIRALDLVNHAEHLLVHIPNSDIKGMDVDYESRTVFWLESQEGLLNKKQVTFDGSPGSNITTLRANLTKPVHLSWDWIGRNFYFFSDGYIVVCNENASICVNVIPTGFVMINSLVVVPEHGILFFSLWSDKREHSSGLIERADMNGARRSKIIQRDSRVQWPTGLTADPTIERLYWTDASKGQIGTCDFRGFNRSTLLAYSLAYPFGLAYFEDNLYIANMGSDTMIKCSKFNGRSRMITHRNNIKSERMRIYHPVLQRKNSSNPCLHSQCDHLCLLRENGMTCSCGDRFSISNDGTTCVPDADAIPFGDKAYSTCGCLNGGHCDADGTCVCPSDFTGSTCQTRLVAAASTGSSGPFFSYTMIVLGILCLLLVLAIFLNYFFDGPVTMHHVRSLSPSRLRNNPRFRDIVISFRNPVFKRSDDSLIEGEERDGYESGPEEDQNMNYTFKQTDGRKKKKEKKKHTMSSTMVRNMSTQSGLSEYHAATFEPLPSAYYDAENQTFSITVSGNSFSDESRLLP